MPTPAITTSIRYMDVGATRVYYLPAIAATTLVPTRAEMNAGTNLSPELADWSGWMLDAELLDTQNMGQGFKSEIPGSLSSPPCSFTFYSSKNGIDVRTVLTRLASGFIMILDGGDITANKAEVWPITVASVSVDRGTLSADSAGADAASRIRVVFAITAQPAQGVTVPA